MRVSRTRFPDACKDCAERHPGCHGDCKRYLEAKEAHEAKKEAYKEAHRHERMLESYHVASIKRQVKLNKRRKGE